MQQQITQCLLLLVSSTPTRAEQVASKDGRLVLLGANSEEPAVLTNGFCDESPSLSVDGKQVIVVRQPSCGNGASNRGKPHSLAIYDRATRSVRVLRTSPFQVGEYEAVRLMSSTLSIDNRKVFFMYDMQAATTLGLGSLDLHTLRVEHVGFALSARLVRRGEYSGKLVVLRRTYLLAPRVEHWYWLIDPIAKRNIGIVGTSEGDVDMFFRIQEEP